MPSNDLGEFTPLVPGSGGNGHPHNHHSNHHPRTQYFPGNNNDNLSRRRHYPNNGFPPHDGNYDDESSYDEAIKGSDRRTYWSRMKEELANMLPVFRGKMRATAADCQDDEQKANFTCKPISSTEEEGRLFYMDTFNDEPWACSFGTREHDGIWLNVHDRVGTVMSTLVWVLVIYSGVTVGLLSQHNHLPSILAKTYFTICALALASHAKTTFTDPGAIPQSAVPVDVYTPAAHAMCSRCQAYKPKGAHHCRICDRCINGMDHHCPWMNNCIGTGNLKHFILFLCYMWTACAFALMMFGWNYFFCNDDHCTFSVVLVQLVRVMTVICVGTLIFTSSMLTNVTYGVMTGVGTIDRLKMKADDTWGEADNESLELTAIFGIGDYWTWALPCFDPVFEDYDLVMGHSTPQRLLRERV